MEQSNNQCSGSNTEATNMSNTTYTQEEQDLFFFDDLVVTVIDESSQVDVEPQLYLESLSSRVPKALTASKGFTDLVELAEAYEDDTKMNVRLNTTPLSSSDFEALVSGIDTKGVASINTPLGVFEVPIPTVEAFPKYQKALNNVAAASIKTLVDASQLLRKSRVDINQTVKQINKICQIAVQEHSKNLERRDIMQSILAVLMVDRVKEQQLSYICDQYSKPEMWIDPISNGLWVVDPSESHPAISAARVRRVVSKYDLDDNQTLNLISLSFSRNARETAAAKLNLCSRVKDERRDDMKKDPNPVLAKIMSEAELSQHEVKAVIFDRSKETKCPACAVHVETEGVTYHAKCPVILWLVENFFFKYDEELGVLSTQRVIYLDQNQRVLLESIQKRHRTLNQPFKIKGGAKYAVMKRDGQSLKTLTSLQADPRFMPGTPEWMERLRKEDQVRKRH